MSDTDPAVAAPERLRMMIEALEATADGLLFQADIEWLAPKLLAALATLGFVVVPATPRNADEGEAAEQRYMDWLMRP